MTLLLKYKIRQAPYDNNVHTLISLRKNPGAIYNVKLINLNNIEYMNLVKLVLAAVRHGRDNKKSQKITNELPDK